MTNRSNVHTYMYLYIFIKQHSQLNYKGHVRVILFMAYGLSLFIFWFMPCEGQIFQYVKFSKAFVYEKKHVQQDTVYTCTSSRLPFAYTHLAGSLYTHTCHRPTLHMQMQQGHVCTCTGNSLPFSYIHTKASLTRSFAEDLFCICTCSRPV